MVGFSEEQGLKLCDCTQILLNNNKLYARGFANANDTMLYPIMSIDGVPTIEIVDIEGDQLSYVFSKIGGRPHTLGRVSTNNKDSVLRLYKK